MQNIESDCQASKPGKTVLVVDDNPMVRRAVRAAFHSDGFAVCGEARDGQEAITLAGKLSPDLIILDLSMPVMNGLQAAPVLRKLVPKSPIILFTVYIDKIVEQELCTIDVDAVFSKGEPLSKLLEEAHALLGD
jgi:two-component system, response regulator PdtaR